MYLEPEQVSNVFRDAHKAGGPGSRFVFTFLEPLADGRVGFVRRSRFVDWWLRRRSEPFRWGQEQTEMAGYLAAHGWRLQKTLTPAGLRRRYLAEEPPLPAFGDLIGLADWEAE